MICEVTGNRRDFEYSLLAGRVGVGPFGSTQSAAGATGIAVESWRSGVKRRPMQMERREGILNT